MFAKEQTVELCLAAVQQNGLALQYIKEQTLELCLAAVKQNNHALKLVWDEFYADIEASLQYKQ